jgi:hypothetical protein
MRDLYNKLTFVGFVILLILAGFIISLLTGNKL